MDPYRSGNFYNPTHVRDLKFGLTFPDGLDKEPVYWATIGLDLTIAKVVGTGKTLQSALDDLTVKLRTRNEEEKRADQEG